MATIVIATWGSYGDVFPYMGLGQALRQRGHTPILAMPEFYRSAVESAGLGFHPLRPDLDLHDQAMAERVMDPARGTQFLFNELLIPALEASRADLVEAAAGADLLVTHPAVPAGPMVAEEKRLPWASTVLAPISFFSMHDPVVPAPAPWLYALTSRSPLLARLFVRLTERVTRRWAAPVQRFRRSLGLPEGGNPVMGGQHSPYLVLALFSRLLAEAQPDWPPNVRVTGPILYNPGDQEMRLPDEMEAFLGAGEPPVVFTLGSSAVRVAGSFYHESAAAMRQLGRRAVLLVGRDAVDPPVSDDTVRVVEFAPHSALFPRAAAIVHQGGAGTLHQALASGRPTIVVPHAHDQPDNARRVRSLGVSRTVYPDQYAAERIGRDLRDLLRDEEVAERAAEVGRVVRAEGGAAAACDAIEGLLERTAPVRR